MKQPHKHLHRLPITLPSENAVVYFITCCTHNRRHIFTTEAIVKTSLDELAKSREKLQWWVGGVVFMPDHVHLFCSPSDRDNHDLPRFIGAWRSAVSRKLKLQDLEEPFWQVSFFDHILRSDESYDKKWEYVRQNPDRAGLADFQRSFELDKVAFR
jgi:REP element-mobilizing transposase RayT